jgi:DNA-binding phage protein
MKMAKITASKKQKNAPKKPVTYAPMKSPELKNSRLVSETLLECIRTGDLDVFRDVLASHIMSTNKLQLSKRTGIGRRTLYDILDPKINFNPELSTVSALIRGLAEC